MPKSVFLNQPRFFLFAIQILLALTPAVVNANAVTPEIPAASDNEDDFMLPNEPLFEDKRNWQSLQGAWGKRDDIDADLMGDEKIVPIIIATNLDEKPIMRLGLLTNNAVYEPVAGYETLYDDNIYNDKRTWKKMNVAWGKRRNAEQNWNRGSWGKREPNWNNLKGMWGKRAVSGKWHRLNQGFGKRSVQYSETN